MLERYLKDMHVLSSTPKTVFRYEESENRWKEEPLQYERYIIQPAIKYYHLKEVEKFIKTEDYYLNLTDEEKDIMINKLDEKIKGDITEQIVLYDVRKSLPKEKYKISKPVFYKGRQLYGEYDMLVWNREKNSYYGFEIKHSEEPYYKQAQHLEDSFLKEEMDYVYGNKENAAVLYRGNPFLSDTGTYYLNLTDFMLTVDKYKDMEKVFGELTKDLSVINLRKLNELEEKFSEENTTLDERLRISEKIIEIRNAIDSKDNSDEYEKLDR